MSPPDDSTAVSAAVEDYLKAIWSLTRQAGSTASTSELAQRLGLSAGSVSTMVKRLAAAGAVDHLPYHGVRLSAQGERMALRVIRRHRLIELFLAESLDIPWDDVHRFADALEHAASDELIEIIAGKLGDPTADPHGDPIPTADLVLAVDETVALSELEPGRRARLVRVSDADPEMLRHLAEGGIAIGDELEMVARGPFGGSCEVRIADRTHALGRELADAIRVR